MMTKETILTSLSKIEQLKGDNEAAHFAEDALHQEFIEHVAAADLGELSEMASLVLSTQEMDFTRWYA